MTVYFAQPTGQPLDPIKIGFTTNAEERRAHLARFHKCEMTFLATCNGGRRLERALHEIFAHHRISGEWFEPCDDLLRLVDDVRRNGEDALPQIDEVAVVQPGVRVELIRDEASDIVKALGGIHGSKKEQIARAAEKAGLSETIVERLRYKKSERIYADIMDTLRIALANQMDAVCGADLLALKRHVARLRLTQPGLRVVAA